MVFSSAIFLLIFFPVVLAGYYNPFIKTRAFRNIFLLAASLIFYAWGEPIFVFNMLVSIVVSWLVGLGLEKYPDKRKTIIVIGTIYHVMTLLVFKYLTFLAQELGLLLHKDFSWIQIALPIGISFFTFQLMSYQFDVYYGKAKTQKNLLCVGLYTALFPQLIAGPIVRYQQVADEIEERRENWDDFAEGIRRFSYGLGKKVLIANYAAQIADNIFAMVPGERSVLTAWIGAIAYSIQIYFDFSGYSDMAIGLGKVFGFHFSENFNYPYISASVTEFWRRWHISLSSWFRDYVYIPLGGNRVKHSRWILNMLAVWLLTGIWHGANWTFLVWGLFYFCLLMLEKETGFTKKLKGFSHVYTLVMVMIAWVIFRADNMEMAAEYIGNLFGAGTSVFVDSTVFYYLKNAGSILLLSFLCSLPIYPWLKQKFADSKIAMLENILVVLIFILALIKTISSSYNPFIYFNF